MDYRVKRGDTISKISAKHDLRPFDILLENHSIINEHTYIYPGMTLYLPEYKRQAGIGGDIVTEYGPLDLEDDLKQLVQSNVDIKKCGHSVLGTPIYQIKIGTGKKQVFYSGGWHANEWHTSKFLMKFLYTCVEALQSNSSIYSYNIKQLLEKVTLIIVPMVNPDGIELVQQGIYKEHPYYHEVLKINKGSERFEHWSSNIRGVDLNHQWPAGWEKEAKESPQQPWPRHFSGIAPLTEPEAQAIYKCTLNHDFSYVLAFHSQGQVIYWGYRGYEPAESKDMVQKLSLVSSYTPIHTAESDGGYKDWFIQETKRPGFTIEVGVGVNPLNNDAINEIWSNNLFLALEGLRL